MRVILSESKEAAISAVVTAVVDKLSLHPASVIGLATGKTMEPVYSEWVKLAKDQRLDLSKSFYFMLDEYLSLAEGHPSSFKRYIQDRLQFPLNLHADQFAFPPVHLKPFSEGASHYEKSLKASGGIDLQLLGLGVNGHIGFNEPGSTGDSRTRVVKLTQETMNANKDAFAAGEMPEEALSMGIGSILEAQSIWMLVTGNSKADAVKYLMNHHDDPKCPATFLKSHSHFTLVLDPAAASKINLKI